MRNTTMLRTLIIAVIVALASSANAQIIVAELFNNIDCANCRQPDDGFDTLMIHHPEYNILPIYYHVDFPAPNDPFNLASKTDVDGRFVKLYKLGSTPSAYIDGEFAGGGDGCLAKWTSRAQLRYASGALPVVVDLAARDSAGSLVIDMTATGSVSGTGVKPYCAIIESGLYYDNSLGYGPVPNGIWNNVFRAMVPASGGGPTYSQSGVQHFHYVVDTTGRGWTMKNLAVVGFLQDNFHETGANTSYLMYGAAYTAVQTAGVASDGQRMDALGTPSPNPSLSFARIPFTLSKSAIVRISVCDALGREVAVIANGTYNEGASVAEFDPTTHTAGVYVANMTVNGRFVGSQKIVLQ